MAPHTIPVRWSKYPVCALNLKKTQDKTPGLRDLRVVLAHASAGLVHKMRAKSQDSHVRPSMHRWKRGHVGAQLGYFDHHRENARNQGPESGFELLRDAVDEQAAAQFGFEPGRFGRHDLAGVRDGEQLVDAGGAQRERYAVLARPGLKLIGSANAAHE